MTVVCSCKMNHAIMISSLAIATHYVGYLSVAVSFAEARLMSKLTNDSELSTASHNFHSSNGAGIGVIIGTHCELSVM